MYKMGHLISSELNLQPLRILSTLHLSYLGRMGHNWDDPKMMRHNG